VASLYSGKKEVLHGLEGSELAALGVKGIKPEVLHLQERRLL